MALLGSKMGFDCRGLPVMPSTTYRWPSCEGTTMCSAFLPSTRRVRSTYGSALLSDTAFRSKGMLSILPFLWAWAWVRLVHWAWTAHNQSHMLQGCSDDHVPMCLCGTTSILLMQAVYENGTWDLMLPCALKGKGATSFPLMPERTATSPEAVPTTASRIPSPFTSPKTGACRTYRTVSSICFDKWNAASFQWMAPELGAHD